MERTPGCELVRTGVIVGAAFAVLAVAIASSPSDVYFEPNLRAVSDAELDDALHSFANGHPDVRIEMAKRLGLRTIGNDEAQDANAQRIIDALRRAVAEDESTGVRFHTAIALARFCDRYPEHKRLFRQATAVIVREYEKQSRWIAAHPSQPIWALGALRVSTPGVQAILEGLSRSPNPWNRRIAVEAIREFADEGWAAARLQAALRDPDTEVRNAAG